MSKKRKMIWFEQATKTLMLIVGVIGVVVIYAGFFFLLITQSTASFLPWYILISPWLCIYFGLSGEKQRLTLLWLRRKLFFWRKFK
ncbi:MULTISPECIES: hypothetical protein [Shewanella]|uniref:Uncharacterized protein n=1 Tax=Shewanella loihica (strain ATCC BAA-1088 / PV-4) TaxID=323850 RepID=A3QDJ3_SHELP|nr:MULTISPECIES: hypothetical protein [Shewanella]ABO23541.1 conserved hypothetical protein [Shewanella loihica PV-4]QYJ84014.1 hypothetical protein K0H80_08520 [Shewanella aegiceratis]QYJ95414.1 hypothetical protein K0I31_08675 [Shewanella spartinae]